MVEPIIPKILHQIWIQGWDAMPEAYKNNAKTWKDTHKDWQYMFWDDTKIATLIIENQASLPSTYLLRYLAYDIPVLKADFGRVLILYILGGIYLDTDTVGVSKFNSALHFPNPRKAYVSDALWPMHFHFFRNMPPHMPSNYVLAGPPKHVFWKIYLDHMVNADATTGGSVQVTGPIGLGQLVKNNDASVAVLERNTFVLPSQSAVPGKTVGIHNYDSTWISKIFRPFTQKIRYISLDVIILVLLSFTVVYTYIRRHTKKFVVSSNKEM